MKCLHCQTDSNYKDRTGKKCPSCHRHFAFEPRDGDPVTDILFHNAIQAVSAEGKIRWGVEHLFYEVNRRKLGSRPQFWAIAIMSGIGAAAIYLGIRFHFFFFMVALIFISMAVSGAIRSMRHFVRIEKIKFDQLWKQWCSAHGQPKEVIVRTDQSAQKKKHVEPDLGDYSFDRAVICDRARTVDLLLANNFHFENNCAVLSIDGYPKGPFETVKTMLKRNPKLQVFALHDATPEGCRMPRKLAKEPSWFDGKIPVIDVGLRPAQALGFSGLYLPAKRRGAEAGEGITEAEAEWFQKYQLELAVIRPEQVLKRLFQAITQTVDTTRMSEDGVIYPIVVPGRSNDSSSSGSSDGGSSGSFDSFG